MWTCPACRQDAILRTCLRVVSGVAFHSFSALLASLGCYHAVRRRGAGAAKSCPRMGAGPGADTAGLCTPVREHSCFPFSAFTATRTAWAEMISGQRPESSWRDCGWWLLAVWPRPAVSPLRQECLGLGPAAPPHERSELSCAGGGGLSVGSVLGVVPAGQGEL